MDRKGQERKPELMLFYKRYSESTYLNSKVKRELSSLKIPLLQLISQFTKAIITLKLLLLTISITILTSFRA